MSDQSRTELPLTESDCADLARCPDEMPLAILLDLVDRKPIDGEVIGSGNFEVDIDSDGVTITGV